MYGVGWSQDWSSQCLLSRYCIFLHLFEFNTWSMQWGCNPVLVLLVCFINHSVYYVLVKGCRTLMFLKTESLYTRFRLLSLYTRCISRTTEALYLYLSLHIREILGWDFWSFNACHQTENMHVLGEPFDWTEQLEWGNRAVL